MFKQFGTLVREKWNEMVATGKVFQTDVDKYEIFDTYLNAFEDDPIFIVNQEHNCNCCKQFIRAVGGAVVVNNDGSLTTIWDIEIEGKYKPVVEALAAYVKSRPIIESFKYSEPTVGQEATWHETKGSFDHFYVENPLTSNVALADKQRAFKRALTEITDEALANVTEYIDNNAILQSTTYLKMVKDFRKAKEHIKDNENLTWFYAFDYFAGIRNTAIGTLLVDLSSSSVDEEVAIRKYNKKVDPRNYKHAAPIVTKRSAEATLKALDELGYKSALDRRQATIHDISIKHVLYKDMPNVADTQPSIENLLGKAVEVTEPKNVTEIGIEKFISDVLPTTTKAEVYLSEYLLNKNKVTMTTNQNTEANSMFKWDNHFGWSYANGLTDSIEQRVKEAGGVTDTDFGISLSWDTKDDLDLALKVNDLDTVYYQYKKVGNFCLDIDANAGVIVPEPVENIYTTKPFSSLSDGTYKVRVHNYTQREPAGSAYQLRIKIKDSIYTYISADNCRLHHRQEDIISIIKKGDDISIKVPKRLTLVSETTKGKFYSLNSMILSPNYWDNNQVGNKHYFFMLDNVEFTDTVKGFYVEFLKEELKPYRRVMEYLSGTLECEKAMNPLVGVGFSASQRESVLIRINNKRTYKVII